MEDCDDLLVFCKGDGPDFPARVSGVVQRWIGGTHLRSSRGRSGNWGKWMPQRFSDAICFNLSTLSWVWSGAPYPPFKNCKDASPSLVIDSLTELMVAMRLLKREYWGGWISATWLLCKALCWSLFISAEGILLSLLLCRRNEGLRWDYGVWRNQWQWQTRTGSAPTSLVALTLVDLFKSAFIFTSS